ncbi:hypothetical protein AMTR_s00133p00033390 [Amborella trichopoda]|uniref:Uncharacterized protein n=1 Tax=Amborella trichopoda TaxID=13333 RepID=W1P3G4_AMBTC|nr:hypothetical protein AMTR_s00133p00033390 [Amborella trichopoda]
MANIQPSEVTEDRLGETWPTPSMLSEGFNGSKQLMHRQADCMAIVTSPLKQIHWDPNPSREWTAENPKPTHPHNQRTVLQQPRNEQDRNVWSKLAEVNQTQSRAQNHEQIIGCNGSNIISLKSRKKHVWPQTKRKSIPIPNKTFYPIPLENLAWIRKTATLGFLPIGITATNIQHLQLSRIERINPTTFQALSNNKLRLVWRSNVIYPLAIAQVPSGRIGRTKCPQ